MRWLLICALAALLGGCNLVSSKAPLFGPADTAGAPAFKPGLWAVVEPGCRFRASAPPARWPKCAEPVVVDGERIFPGFAGEQSAEYLVTGGDPAIVQYVAGEDADRRFAFLAVHVARADRAGRASAIKVWLVECGPPPPKGATWPDGQPRYLSLALGHGLAPDGDGCLAADPAAVRAAAAATVRRGEPVVMRWLRAAP